MRSHTFIIFDKNLRNNYCIQKFIYTTIYILQTSIRLQVQFCTEFSEAKEYITGFSYTHTSKVLSEWQECCFCLGDKPKLYLDFKKQNKKKVEENLKVNVACQQVCSHRRN